MHQPREWTGPCEWVIDIIDVPDSKTSCIREIYSYLGGVTSDSRGVSINSCVSFPNVLIIFKFSITPKTSWTTRSLSHLLADMREHFLSGSDLILQSDTGHFIRAIRHFRGIPYLTPSLGPLIHLSAILSTFSDVQLQSLAEVIAGY
jgi:hypothetical protein